MQHTDLIEKIEKLSPETVVEVEHFVDCLTMSQDGGVNENIAEWNSIYGEKIGSVNLRELGISEEEAAAQRGALASFAEDWERPEMGIYDKL